ncbi:MAG: S-adenosyl-methyltransferase MraW [candidate division WS6 bacterium 34_10]|uniref:Ribosomal RNA small subunit methyltransferase H n=1 Tax=candidate division WS6 bacterium 34_10 TaxID=1641389 RepID=A0A101HHX4_9BACT|nr:MAG: S-adenosyl-methyltransferase MraW [candidate division WS6 bacterium 34_10]
MDKIHIPVLLDESIEALNVKPDGFYIDCTLGDGGHSNKILSQLSSQGLLLSIDQDQNAIDFVKSYYDIPENWIIEKGNFANIKEILARLNTDKEVSGILMDIGLSSRQLEESEGRGFSYKEEDEPLDMRMDQELGVNALDLLKVLKVHELTKLFKVYGEERFAKPIAKAIKEDISEINTVGDLTSLIYNVVPVAQSNKNPSRRVFQALRIAVNDELNSLKEGLDNAFEILTTGGRIAVISFHSLEDRIVKDYFNEKEESKHGKLVNEKPITATEEEINRNPRSSSAKLRVLEKI